MTRPTTAERLSALEQRVAELEAHPRREPADATDLTDPVGADPAAGPYEEVFWALEGLRARLPDPGGAMITGSVTLPDERIAQWQLALDTATLLDSDWTEVADVLAALGNPVRVRLLRAVLSGTASVRDLTELDGVGTSGQVYHHLRQLVAAGWLASTGGGRYEVPVARVVPLLTTVLGARR